MQRSTDRILTTHTGSLPRPADLAELLMAVGEGEVVDDAMLRERVAAATTEIVRRQVALGIDVVSDGEMSKLDYVGYVRDRLTGFADAAEAAPFSFGDLAEFPDIAQAIWGGTHLADPECVGPIAYVGHEAVARNVADLAAAVAQSPPTEAFIPAVSPGIVAMSFRNRHYASYEDYVFALAEGLSAEYRAIVDAGFLVQVDAPELALGADYHTWMRPEVERRGFAALQELHVEALNVALAGIAAERVRMHVCWANYMGPHTHDLGLAEVLEPALRANVGAIDFEGANPAHAHEWELLGELRLPDDKVLIPGVIDTKTQVVEHPEVVAQRLVRYVELVGRERVIAGTDCGFGSMVGAFTVHPKVAWLKLDALAKGAELASLKFRRARSISRA